MWRAGRSSGLPETEPELPSEPGLTLVEMMDAALAGEVKALYVMGENPVIADPHQVTVAELEAWTKDLHNYAITYQLAVLAAKTPHAPKLAAKWRKAKAEGLRVKAEVLADRAG